MVKLRYIEAPSDWTATATLFLTEEQERQLQIRLLARLGIEVRPGEKALHAWLRAMHVENGLIPESPANPGIRDAILGNPEAMRFMFILA
jgi:hypothetical protein